MAGTVSDGEFQDRKQALTSAYNAEIARVHILYVEGLLSEDEHAANHDAIMAELRAECRPMAAKPAPLTAFRPLSRSEVQAAEAVRFAAQAEALKLRRANGLSRGGILAPTSKGPGLVAPLGSKLPTEAPKPKVRPPEEPSTADLLAVRTAAEVKAATEAFLDGSITLEIARERINAARGRTFKAGPGNSFKVGTTEQGIPCHVRTATGWVGCNGDPSQKNTCQLCGGKGRLTLASHDVPIPMLDIRPEGGITVTVWSEAGEPTEVWCQSGHDAVRTASRLLLTAGMVRATVDAGVILTMREDHKSKCLACNGLGAIVVDQNHSPCTCEKGIATRERVTRLWFGDDPKGPKGGGKTAEDKAHAALVASLSETGYKRTMIMSCHKCKGKGCDACKAGRIFMATVHHATSAMVNREILKADLRREERDLPVVRRVASRDSDKWINKGSAMAAAAVNAKGGVQMRGGAYPEDSGAIKARSDAMRAGRY